MKHLHGLYGGFSPNPVKMNDLNSLEIDNLSRLSIDSSSSKSSSIDSSSSEGSSSGLTNSVYFSEDTKGVDIDEPGPSGSLISGFAKFDVRPIQSPLNDSVETTKEKPKDSPAKTEDNRFVN
jgi:hypothetical protein